MPLYCHGQPLADAWFDQHGLPAHLGQAAIHGAPTLVASSVSTSGEQGACAGTIRAVIPGPVMRPTEPQSAIDGAHELPDPFVEQLLATLHSHRDGHAPSNEAFVVSVFGEWGVGKTHCLKCVYQRLNEELMLALQALGPQAPTSSVPPLIIPVAFDAWRYERDEHLVILC